MYGRQSTRNIGRNIEINVLDIFMIGLKIIRLAIIETYYLLVKRLYRLHSSLLQTPIILPKYICFHSLCTYFRLMPLF